MKNNLSIAIKAAIEAGEEILKVYATNFDIEIKGDQSPLTLADKNANNVINSYLQKTAFPIISEENRQLDFSERKSWETCWIVDPLDGTKEFIKRNGEFTVNIALVKNGNPIQGVIYVPISKTLYFTNEDASKSYKLILESKDISLESIFLNATEILPAETSSEVIKIVGSRSHLNEETRYFISKIKNKEKTEIISLGSSLKFCFMAEGKADIYPRFSPTMEWDTAAGQAICQSVGLQFLDAGSLEPLKYNKNSLLNPSFIVSNHYF